MIRQRVRNCSRLANYIGFDRIPNLIDEDALMEEEASKNFDF